MSKAADAVLIAVMMIVINSPPIRLLQRIDHHLSELRHMSSMPI
jgi:hypothetical protein